MLSLLKKKKEKREVEEEEEWGENIIRRQSYVCVCVYLSKE